MPRTYAQKKKKSEIRLESVNVGNKIQVESCLLIPHLQQICSQTYALGLLFGTARD